MKKPQWEIFVYSDVNKRVVLRAIKNAILSETLISKKDKQGHRIKVNNN